MQEALKICIDRLSSGKTEKIEGVINSSFLGVMEKELQFPSPVVLSGEAYLADDHLIIHLNASTKARMPCAICNEMIETDLTVDHFYHAEAIEDIKGAVFDYSEPLREAILIELPRYIECRSGNCPERKAIAPYLRKSDKSDGESQFPFAGLDI